MPSRPQSSFHSSGEALLTAAQMAEADVMTASTGHSTWMLMEAAGAAVATAATAMAPHGPILVIAGRGSNGGDGLVAARLLAEQGRDVAVKLLCRRETLQGDAAQAARAFAGTILDFQPETIGQPALIVDALFGAGLNRPVKGEPLRMIQAINASGVPALGVDLPSGIDADTGAALGDAVRATRTVTFFRRKPGHLLLPGRVHCGPVEVVQIGIANEVLRDIAPQTFVNDPALWSAAFPMPQIEGHKYMRGHAVVASGHAAHTGAARLAARAALRAGAGLVTVASPSDALAINAAALTAVMVRPSDGPAGLGDLLTDKRLNAVLIGPGAGVGQETREMVRVAVASERAMLLDADALTSFADRPHELFAALKSSPSPAVLTPHQGEFVRLFKELLKDSKLAAARMAAALSSSVIVFKGPDTVVAAPDGRAAITENAPPWLATAGAGDVLGGMIIGLLAQGVPSFEAACMGVWLHGEAAREFGPGLIADDLADALPTVLRRLYSVMGDHSQASTK